MRQCQIALDGISVYVVVPQVHCCCVVSEYLLLSNVVYVFDFNYRWNIAGKTRCDSSGMQCFMCAIVEINERNNIVL